MSDKFKIPKRENIFEHVYSMCAKILTPYFLNYTPNQITLISGFLGVIGSFLLISSNYFILLIAAVLIQIYSVLDLVDGNIAREKNLQSKYGMWLDIFFDKLIDFLIILFICLGVYIETKNTNILIMGIVLMGVVFFNQFIMLLNDTYFSSNKVEEYNSIYLKDKNNFFKLALIPIIFYRKHLSLQHNTFLFLISFFTIIDQIYFAIYFLTIHGIISLILSILTNFIKLKNKL